MRMSGAVNEHADFSPVRFARRPPLEIDLGELEMINSTGLRSFSRWVNGLENATLQLSHVPKFFVEQINMVGGLIPPRSKVISFYVPYYCDQKDEEQQILYRTGLEFARDGEKIKIDHPKVSGKDCNFEMDVVPAKYFKFLTKFA